MSDESIFQEGDVIYHPYFGRGEVKGSNYKWTTVMHGTVEEMLDNDSATAFLSFSEWPAPNHIRPLKNGVYKVEYGGEHWVMCFRENVWYFVDSSYTTMIGKEVGFPDDVKNPEFLYSLKYHQ